MDGRLWFRAALAIAAMMAACGPAGGGGEAADGAGPFAPRIIRGVADRTDTAVVALTTGGSEFCSGTLVSSRTVFTAGHCVVESGLAARDVEVFFGDTVGGAGAFVPVAAWGAHPGYHVREDGAPIHDVAWVTLARDAPVAPMAWHATPLPELVGQTVWMVGYGVTSAAYQDGEGTRRKVLQVIAAQDEAFLYYGDGRSGTCQGDSGGPTIVEVDGVPTLIAVTSYGDVSCVGFGANTRVDAYAGFLAAHVTGDAGAAPAPAGEPETPAGDGTPESEPNKGRGSAADAVLMPGSLRGTIDGVKDVDYFRVVLPAGAALGASLAVPPDLNLDLQLQDADGGALAASGRDLGVDESLSWTNGGAKPRVVYLKVSGVDGSASAAEDYRLDVAW